MKDAKGEAERVSPSSWRRVEGPKQPFVRAVMFEKAPIQLAGCLKRGLADCPPDGKTTSWKCDNDGELYRSVTPGPLGLVGSNPAISTR